jgi:hypothetical protein
MYTWGIYKHTVDIYISRQLVLVDSKPEIREIRVYELIRFSKTRSQQLNYLNEAEILSKS